MRRRRFIGDFRPLSFLDFASEVLHLCSTMKTATVRDLRNRYTALLAWVEAGQEIRITRRGRTVARLIPERTQMPRVAWSESPAVRRKRKPVAKIAGTAIDRSRQDSAGRW
jgi:prevent-host-death family protein